MQIVDNKLFIISHFKVIYNVLFCPPASVYMLVCVAEWLVWCLSGFGDFDPFELTILGMVDLSQHL